MQEPNLSQVSSCFFNVMPYGVQLSLECNLASTIQRGFKALDAKCSTSGKGISLLYFVLINGPQMGGNGLIVSFGEAMPMRRGRLQRQSRRAFWASAVPEVSTSELAGWCWARQTLIEKRAPSRWQRESMIRAARSIGAVRTRRIGREWLWRLPDAVAPLALSRV